MSKEAKHTSTTPISALELKLLNSSWAISRTVLTCIATNREHGIATRRTAKFPWVVRLSTPFKMIVYLVIRPGGMLKKLAGFHTLVTRHLTPRLVAKYLFSVPQNDFVNLTSR